jgi:hypothetical protein
MIRARWLLGTFVLLGALVTPLRAQQRPHRSGFYLELGGGVATSRASCAGCEDVTRNNGNSSTLRLGFPLSDHVMLGLEAFSFGNKGGFSFYSVEDESRVQTSTTQAVVLWYPTKTGLFVKGGTGIAESQFFVPQEGSDSVSVKGTGVGLTLGLGYDLNLSRRFALTTNAGIHVTAIGDVQLPSGPVDDVIATIYSLNIGLTLR